MRMRLRIGLEAGLGAPDTEAAGDEGRLGGRPAMPCGAEDVAEPGE